MNDRIKNIANNKQAYHLYFIEDTLEVGIELFGTEVKSIRQGKVNLKDSYVAIQDGEAFVKLMHVSPYEKGNIWNKDPLRERKLLLHKREIAKFKHQIMADGYAIVPLSIYLKGDLVKLSIALARGKKLHDKRDSAAEKSAKRDMARAIKERNQ